MSFRVTGKDLLGRTGILETKSGSFQTPHMFPVVDPNRPEFTKRLLKHANTKAIMTNAYLLKRALAEPSGTLELHKHLGFSGTIATDSGAYQILQFGKVSISPSEIVEFQEAVNSDIAVILDIPTGFKSSVERAQWTVNETLRRADEALTRITRKDMLWVGPVQGGTHLDEVARSAREMAKRTFAIYALGSPTELMETQQFETLVDMIITAKKELPFSKPFHLFGAGHPAIFPYLVALGCDLFDSAAYALYAQSSRYMTSDGTLELDNMVELPCQCSVCTTHTAESLRSLEPGEREESLSTHNLQTCLAELRRIREAIRNGRLWELLELRSNAHPAFKRCFDRVRHHSLFLERFTPSVKPHGIFYLGQQSGSRPEVVRYFTKTSITAFSRPFVLVLLPGRWKRRPFHEDPDNLEVVRLLRDRKDTAVGFYSLVFGYVPLELDEAFPIPQTEAYDMREEDQYNLSALHVVEAVKRISPNKTLLVCEERLGTLVKERLALTTARLELVTREMLMSENSPG